MEKAASPQVPAGCKPLTTFVHTDTNSFREVVQRLTGPTEPNPSPSQKDQSTPPNPMNKMMGLKKPKLHERRHQGIRPKLEIVKPNFQISPFTSPIGTPSTILSTLTLKDESFKKSDPSALTSQQEEDKAIQERRFYLHPSPRDRDDFTEPELLTLFPLESPNTN